MLHLDDGPTTRGGQRQLALLLEGQQRDPSLRVRVLARAPAVVERLRATGVECQLWRGAGDPRGWWQARSALPHADLVHVHDARSHGVAAALLADGGSTKLVVHRRIDDTPGRSWIDQKKYQHGHFIAVSHGVATVLRGAGVRDDRIDIVHSAVPHTDAAAMPPVEDAFRTVALGALVPHKGHDLLIAALAQVASEAKLVLIGEGPRRAALQKAIVAAGLHNRVLLAGDIDDPNALYAPSHVHVQPSRTEGLGTAILFAAMQGRPVIVTKVGGAPECVSPEGGWVVEPDATSIAVALAAAEDLARRDLPRFAAMGLEARRFVIERFSPERMVVSVGEVYRKLR